MPNCLLQSRGALRPLLAAVCLGALLCAPAARAWDAGPAKCKHDPCTGGLDERSFPDTRPRYLRGDCPAGSKRSAISTCVHKVKFRGNTHLWVVLGGVKLLQASADPVAKRVAAILEAPQCKAQWESGLWDGDDGKLSEPGGAHGTHFYNGGGKDAFGKATKILTYTVASKEMRAFGTARDHAKKHAAQTAALAQDPECKTQPGKAAA